MNFISRLFFYWKGPDSRAPGAPWALPTWEEILEAPWALPSSEEIPGALRAPWALPTSEQIIGALRAPEALK